MFGRHEVRYRVLPRQHTVRVRDRTSDLPALYSTRRTRKSPMVKVRQVACRLSPRWTVGGTPDQSVTVNGSVGIFMRSHPAFLGDHRAVCRLLEALRHQANPADRGRTLIESDHHVGDIGFLEQGHFVFGQLDANRGQRVVEVLELGSADNGRGDNRLSQ